MADPATWKALRDEVPLERLRACGSPWAEMDDEQLEETRDFMLMMSLALVEEACADERRRQDRASGVN